MGVGEGFQARVFGVVEVLREGVGGGEELVFDHNVDVVGGEAGAHEFFGGRGRWGGGGGGALGIGYGCSSWCRRRSEGAVVVGVWVKDSLSLGGQFGGLGSAVFGCWACSVAQPW